MTLPRLAVSLMLTVCIPLLCLAAGKPFLHQRLHARDTDLAARDVIYTPPTTSSPCYNENCVKSTTVAHLPCGQANGTQFAGNNSIWTMLCDTDFFAQDIFPFILTKTFEECMEHCEIYNEMYGHGKCAGYVFAPDRINLENSCYLKSSVNGVIYPASIHLIAGVLHPATATSTRMLPIPAFTSVPATTTTQTISAVSIVTPPHIESSQPVAGDALVGGRQPIINKSTYLGISVNEPVSQYVHHAPAKPQQLAADMLQPVINVDLITKFPLAPDTGSWTDAQASRQSLAEMSVVPRLARDGGRGGNINGTNIFIFCDTSTYGEDKDPVLGYLNGFVSSSVAVDQTMNALNGKPLSFVNSLGQWQDDVGRMRGWVPMTTGEEAFNIAISGSGYRYAVWPNASPIPLNDTHSIMHAPLVYLDVDMQDQSSPRYTSLGNTLLLLSIDSIFGPHADRLRNQFFQQHEVNWGSLGGIRAWSSEGQNSLAGDVYIFGQADIGILVGRVAAKNFDDRDKYEYWNGHAWSNEMPPAESTSDAIMIEQAVMNMDVIYSPAHRTFIMIYLTPQADNTFYYRHLVDNDNTTLSIVPPYETDGEANYVEHILSKTWSQEKVLLRIPSPERFYAYAGGLHAGYFGDEDITHGGTKMLLTWTEHTFIDPNKPDSGYAHKSQVVEFGFKAS